MFLSQFAKNYRKNLFSRIQSCSGDFGDGRRFGGIVVLFGLIVLRVVVVESRKNAEEKNENPLKKL